MKQNKIVNLFKKLGQSPLNAIKGFQAKNPNYRDIKLGYAGRLDPMAEGVLLVMIGEENKRRDKFLMLDKEYEVQMVLGIVTDSYDVLGKVVKSSGSIVERSDIKVTIQQYNNSTILQPYPPYSSQTIGGVRMYKLARENKLKGVKFPEKKVKIYNIKIDKITTIKSKKLYESIIKKLAQVSGDFRQVEIKQCWADYFNESKRDKYQIVSFTVSCSSGTYIRSLVHTIGQHLGAGAFVYNLVRTKVGEYKHQDSIKM